MDRTVCEHGVPTGLDCEKCYRQNIVFYSMSTEEYEAEKKKFEQLQAEGVLLRTSLKQLVNLNQFKDMYGKNVEFMAGETNTWRLAAHALNSTPQTAKVQAVLDAAREIEKSHTKNGVHDESWPCSLCEAVRAMEE